MNDYPKDPWRMRLLTLGVRVLSRGEQEVLAHHIVVKGTSDANGPSDKAFADFVRLRFQQPLRMNAISGPWYGRAFTWMSVITIAAGLISSAIVTASSGEELSTTATWIVAGLGVLVGILGAILQHWKPAQRSEVRYQAAHALRDEGWDYVEDCGRYADLLPQERRSAFVTEINRIHRDAESIDEADQEHALHGSSLRPSVP